MSRDKPLSFEEFMVQMESYYLGLKTHRAKPHSDPRLCEVCLSYIRRLQDRVRYLGMVMAMGQEESRGQ